jgi:5-formyltetrahydrofolate cyclo-ligase
VREAEVLKTEIRNKYMKIRRGIPADLKSEADRNILKHVVALGEYKDASLILAYVSKEYEADTRKLLRHAVDNGKKVAVPKTYSGGIMDFHRINDLSDLEQGRLGILEPDVTRPKAENFENAVCFVPAVVFDRRGHRVGHGKGFYDRFLSENPDLCKIGLAYGVCVTDEVPSERFDVAVDKLITENGCVQISGG